MFQLLRFLLIYFDVPKIYFVEFQLQYRHDKNPSFIADLLNAIPRSDVPHDRPGETVCL